MSTGLESIIPDNSRFSINMHYQSDSTHEFGTLRLNKNMSVEDVLKQYSSLFPIESQAFLEEVKSINQSLHRSGGMSKEGVVMAIGKIPKIIFMALEFINTEFWMDLRNLRRFIRAYPRFAIGDHSPKRTHPGVLIK